MGKFEVRDTVAKVSGYRFPGIVTGVVYKLDGSLRYIVEADHPDFEGMTHIFNGDQLKHRVRQDVLPDLPTDVVPGQLWRHANGSEYIVVAVSYDEESLRPLVTYKRYDKGVWTRTYDVFKKRFTRVS